ncbi:M20/M25/M40 family metallo-hydrolase [bacterium]|nr:M20/M25/M40 family metallo-hydrolase [bacterium]
MKRRDFIRAAAGTAFVAPVMVKSSPVLTAEKVGDFIATPEKRAEYLAHMLKALVTDLGPRTVGSPEYDKAAAIVKREMERSLPAVELDTVTFDRWVLIGTPEFTVGDKQIEICPSHGTSGTPPGGIAGVLKKSEKSQIAYEIVDTASGKTTGYVTISPKIKAAPRPYWFYDDKPGGMPNVNIGKPDIPMLDEAVGNKTRVKLSYRTRFIPNAKTSSIIGKLPGESTDEIVYYAHLDTVYNSPGANDNAASLIMVLLIAHAFAGTKPKKTLTFIATTGEEYGYLGTKHLAEKWKRDGSLGRIKYILDFDSVTWGPDMTLITNDEALVSLVRSVDGDLDIPGTPEWRKGDGLGRETMPFRDAGIQARGIVVDSVPVGEVNNLCWHRPDDVAKYISPEYVEIAFQLFGGLMKRLQDL